MEIVVFQQRNSAKLKVEGVLSHGEHIEITRTISVDDFLPDFIEEPEEFIKEDFEADLVLNYFKHPDLVDYLIDLCGKKNIPVVTPGKKRAGFTPFTCCGLGKSTKLGSYGEQFGFPEYRVEMEDNKISKIEVVRGAPCGATWDALENYIGLTVEEVLSKLPRQVQYFCSADPSGFDPVSGKSPVHYAGDVHFAALKKAIKDNQSKDSFRV